ncbi:MAG: primosomal protein N', partial [Kiritimatiellae bacterium]|nr:primosomal protein N' [Kiritimatiellia bacterium]
EAEGTVAALAAKSDFAGRLRPVSSVAPGPPALTPALVRLGLWMADYYLAPPGLCFRTMLPPAIRGSADPGRDGFARERFVRRVPGAPEPETARQKEILSRLGEEGELLSGFLRAWGVSPETVRKMAAAGLVAIEERVRRRDPLAGRRIAPSSPLELNADQRAALGKIVAALPPGGDPRPVLLHGVTASGKTEVYLQAIAETLRRGYGAIVLVPEISLTPQTIRRFVSRFGAVVAVLHSRLGRGERHDEWRRLRSGEARVAVGPRSALFAPVEKLGLVVVDEEHEPSYKQDETPRYHARDVAAVLARFAGCAAVFGSATPSLESWRNARSGKYALCSMPRRATAFQLPSTTIVDMRAEPARGGAGPGAIFSETLVQAIRRRLECGEQTMLFLNRRGWAPRVGCPACGREETCDNCSVAMTYHRDDGVLRCHVCGAWRPVPARCPDCGEEGYRLAGVGTQRVETAARALFPRAKIDRMDLDVTTRKRSHEEILAAFRAGKTDILVGTQMIAKGLDFPNVTLAGILNADSGLAISDFRAAERTFQLVAQMAGRAGRGGRPGDVIVQTRSPDVPAIRLAAAGDYAAFAEAEMREREELFYPPFTRFCLVTFRGTVREAVEAYAARFADAVGRGDPRWILGDPVPAAVERANGAWRFQITLRGEDSRLLHERLRAAFAALPPPGDIVAAADVDALC